MNKKINIPNKLIESNKSKELALYFLFARRRTIDYKVYISINQIFTALGWRRENKKCIINAIEQFKKDGFIIDYIIDGNELEITLVNDLGSYTKFYIEDLKLIRKLGYKIFHVYCFIQRFVNDGCAYFSYEYFEEATKMSRKTLSEAIRLLEAIEILKPAYQGWVYSENLHKNIRKNNEYEINIDKKMEFINMSDEECKKLINEIRNKNPFPKKNKKVS